MRSHSIVNEGCVVIGPFVDDALERPMKARKRRPKLSKGTIKRRTERVDSGASTDTGNRQRQRRK